MSELFPEAGDALRGTVTREVYRNETGAFAVLRVQTISGGSATVTGPLPPVQPGERLEAEGEWIVDPRHGRQFRVREARVQPPDSTQAIERFLGTGTISGVGPELAKRIVETFGKETLDVLNDAPERLLKVKGIGKKKLEKILRSWEDQRASRDTMLYLRGHGIGPVLAARIHTRFGAETRRMIDDDPYLLAREVEGVGFLTADRLARSLGFAEDDPRRLRAGLLHVAQDALSQGSTCLPVGQLLEHAGQTLSATPAMMEPALEDARSQHALELDRPEGEDLIYLPQVLRAERGAARLTAGLLGPGRPRRVPLIDVVRALTWLTERSQLELTDGQADAIRAAVSEPLTVVTGGPGVGKTTVVRSLVELLRAKRVKFALAAPTGRAAKRLEEATGAPASTIHRLLEWDPRGHGFGRDASDPIDVDLLVVDEASMVDVRLYHAVVRALPAGASLVLIGDVDQLPSVGPGAVLADLLACGGARVVRLHEVFRQAASSRIVTSAHAINDGVVPDLSADPAGPDGTDFFFVGRKDPRAVRDTIVKLVSERIPARFGLDPLKDVMVLAPMRRGVCGTEELNLALKAAHGIGTTDALDVGDKVMQLRNDYDNDVFNGDVGRVVEGDGAGGLAVEFDGRRVLYTRGERARLALAYCATIHKSQGSEYPAVVLPVVNEHFMMLQRNLLYTGITRARRLAILVGQRRAIEIAVQNDRPRQRLSLLGTRIRQALEAAVP